MYLVIGRDNCEYCAQATADLEDKNIPYVYKNLSYMTLPEENFWRTFLRKDLHATTVPIVFKLIGGYQELNLLMKYTPVESTNV
jgi:glutaredoxin